MNLAFIAAKDKANPLYWYNDNVTDITNFMSRQVNQHVKLEGNTTGTNSVGPINTQEPMSPELLQFISILRTSANEPVGTGTTQQPQAKRGRDTATEAAIDQQMSDMAQSLQSKVMQFGEAEFWSHWFHRYAKYADELKEKMANIVGVKGINSQIIDMKDFNTDYPPGVLVYSAKEAEYKELVLRRDLMQLYPNLTQTLDADGLRNFNKHVFFPKFLQDPSLIDIMLPKTLDEMNAEDENDQLKKDQYVPIKETDNHTTHIYTHRMVQPNTWALWFHLSEHEKALAGSMQGQGGGQGQGQEQKVSESISYKDLPPEGQKQMAAQAGIQIETPQPLPQQTQTPQGSKPPQINVGKEARSPVAAASPLKTAINPNNSIK
jgi:hypothetical protein